MHAAGQRPQAAGAGVGGISDGAGWRACVRACTCLERMRCMARRSTERSPCSRQYSRSSGARKLDASVHVYTSSPANQARSRQARSRRGLAFGLTSPLTAAPSSPRTASAGVAGTTGWPGPQRSWHVRAARHIVSGSPDGNADHVASMHMAHDAPGKRDAKPVDCVQKVRYALIAAMPCGCTAKM